jgi:hypothetical protein
MTAVIGSGDVVNAEVDVREVVTAVIVSGVVAGTEVDS